MSQSPQEKDVVRRQGQPMDAELNREIEAALGSMSIDELLAAEEKAQQPKDAAASDKPAGPAVRRGRVVAVENKSVLVDLGGKSQAVIPLEQFEDHVPKVGETVEGMFDRYDRSEGLVYLSRRGAVAAAAWGSLAEGQTVEGRVTGVNKGGLELDINGIRGFMPASQVDLYHTEDISIYINQKLRCQVTDMDRRAKNLVLSRRSLLEVEREQNREQMWGQLDVDQVRAGTVRSIMPYGAFVDLGGVDGLLHISDVAWGRVAKVEDVLAVGQSVQVKILKIDREARKLSLGLKQLQADPWSTVANRLSLRQLITGRVTRLADFGAFVEIEPGVEGLIPMSEMAWSRVKTAGDVLKAGQQVEVMVLSIEPDRKRISLSMKQAKTNPWVGISTRYGVDQMVVGKVTRVADFGAFVELEAGVEGLIHVSQLSEKRVNRPGDVVKEGQEVNARIIAVNEDERKISLSLKTQQAAADAPAAAMAAAPVQPRKPRTRPLKGGLDRSGDNPFGLKIGS